MAFDKPSSFRPNLGFLDGTSNDGVWTGTQNGNRFSFRVDSPDFCTGITEANITLKVFMTKETGGFFWPCDTSVDNRKSEFCYFDSVAGSDWLTLSFRVDMSTSVGQVGRLISLLK